MKARQLAAALSLLVPLSGCTALHEVNQAILSIADTMPRQENTCITGPQGVQCYQYTVPRGLTQEQEDAIAVQVTRDMIRSGEASPATVVQMVRDGDLPPAVLTGLVESGDLPPDTENCNFGGFGSTDGVNTSRL